MIARIEGVLVEKSPEAVVLDVHGVGYELRVPLSTFFDLPDEGKTVRLRVHTHVREDAFLLYGFATELERTLFRLLLGASGVGPKLALAILSGLPADKLIAALRSGNLAALVGIPGVGKKTAERMVVELRDKVAGLETATPARAPLDDAAAAAESALVNLGYPRAHAEKAVRRAFEALPDAPGLESLIKEALRAASA
ncbi:MAG TPA: Holliday junction branch migration protein RuvA [Myxococcota bacterium]|nr:Holliday junction branch migration protein RuvA [Myxococcota bacterium]